MSAKITRRWVLRHVASAAVIAGTPLLAAGNASAGAYAPEPDVSVPRVLWFNRERGFGFIEIDGQARFVHLQTLRHSRSQQIV